MQNQLNYNAAPVRAVALRSISLFGILLQYSFIAGTLIDVSIYTTTLLCAFCAGFILYSKKIKTQSAVISLLLAPVMARFLIMLPRIFTGNNLELNIVLDSLLLTYDRNNFAACLPFYYASITTFAAVSSRRTLRGIVLLDIALIIITFIIIKSAELTFYNLPLVLVCVFETLLLLELSARVLALDAEYKLQKNEALFSVVLLIFMALFGGVILIYKLSETSGAGKEAGTGLENQRGFGLMRPGLFSFDMTPFLNLHTEVSMQNELVFIVKKESEVKTNVERHIFMRRFILSDIDFTRNETVDEKSQPGLLPNGAVSLEINEYKKRIPLKQEYYIKNIDSRALLAMNEPFQITPFDNYDSSSFKSVYAVESMVSEAEPFDLLNTSLVHINDAYFGLTKEEFEWYTRFAAKEGGETETQKRIRNLAEEISYGAKDVYSKAALILNYFTKGEFRYSLKPGIAPDGDQLSYFLWTTKRGYCSYFALAYASMLRSIKIPSRIVIGFFLDPETERLGFYPVRSSNAHAWVEVFFPDYGWIAFDPTTDQFAEDELQAESSASQQDNFEQLMKEIIENRDKLKAKQNAKNEENSIKKFIQNAAKKARSFALPILLLIIVFTVLTIRFRYLVLSKIMRSSRAKTIMLWRHLRLRLRLKGFKKTASSSEGEWIAALPNAESLNVLYNEVSMARYAPNYSLEDAKRFVLKYKSFKFILIIILCFGFFQKSADAQQEPGNSNALYDSARRAVYSEHWERAVLLFNEGKKQYPDDWRFAFGLADLYFSNQLYQLAKEEYILVLKIMPDYPEALYKIALTEGNLNNYKDAARYYEEYLRLYPGDYNVISELGWIYFKLHRLREGEKLLLDAIDEFGVHPHLAMTLATIYSDMMNYQEGANWYSQALISSSESEEFFGKQSFSATAWYNFAILESRFFNYEKSLEYSKKSLESFDRDTGHMMQGELYMRRLDWQRSFGEYEKAFSMDNRSPLPKISLAQNFLITGSLQEALVYANDCLKARNGAWMFRFGIDSEQYERDVHEILYKTYKGFYNKQKFVVFNSLPEFIKGKFLLIKYYFKYRINKYLFEKNALASAHSYKRNEMGGQYIDALLQYYLAFENYPRRAAFYLALAADYETELIPASKPGYLYEQGKTLSSTALIDEALKGFDAVWERDMSADALACLSLIADGAKSRDAAAALYFMNPGALLQRGIKLPVEIFVEGGMRKERRALFSRLNKTGFKHEEDSTLALNVKINDNSAEFLLFQKSTGTALGHGRFPLLNAANEISAALLFGANTPNTTR
ncbi:MAG: transglutaminase domain-containing protein [Termitinemataceae bacterium]|nr:MAG: transglutaminase domain-containing protein [Termitinemataceae bacterium]